MSCGHRYARSAACKNIFLLVPIYDLGKLKTLRCGASFYVHGHSAGGTNPSLVEAMHFGKAILAFDCDYNRNTTEGKAIFFKDSNDLQRLIVALEEGVAKQVALFSIFTRGELNDLIQSFSAWGWSGCRV